jgi:hypothetical protein
VNTQRLRSIFGRQNAAPLTFFFLFIVVAVTAGIVQSSATAGGGSGQRPQFPSDEELKKDFNDEDLKAKDDKPGGKWGYATQLDDNQMNDPSVPAYVSGIQLVSGGGKYQGINKIKRVQVRNSSSKTIVLVQVWVEVSSFNEPEKVLLADELPFANASAAPDSSQVVEIKPLYPPRLLKALAKGGELNGNFVIRMGVQAVRFGDGSFWKRSEPAALFVSGRNNR